jgi:hypothetical protein
MIENENVAASATAANALREARTMLVRLIEDVTQDKPSDGWLGRLNAIGDRLSDVGTHIEATDGLRVSTEPEAIMRGCPSCSRQVRADATRCGFCWNKLE